MPITRGHNLPIDQTVNEKLKEIATKMGGGVLRVGFLEDSPSGTYPGGMNVATVALFNEFGHGGTFPAPARSFFRTMIAKESPNWPVTMAHLAQMYDYDGTKVLEVMGKDIEGALHESIVNTNAPELAESTLILRAKFRNNPEDIKFDDVLGAVEAAERGSKGVARVDGEGNAATGAKPLVWTGRMLRGIGSEVVSS